MLRRGWFSRPLLAVLLGVVALFFIQAFDAEGALRILKKVAGEQWRNGSHELAKAYGRTHSEIKGLLVMKSEEFQQRYKQLAEIYANLLEARPKDGGNTVAIDQQLMQVKKDVGHLFNELFGSPEGNPKPNSLPTNSVVLDPIQDIMLALQQRQAEQKKQLLDQMEGAHREEREQVSQQLAEARERHVAIQRLSQSLQIMILDIQRGLEAAQGKISKLELAGTSIDAVMAKIETTVNSLGATRLDLGAVSTTTARLAGLESNALSAKAHIGRYLAGLNQSLEDLANQVRAAETKARSFTVVGGSTGRSVAEQHLQTIASLRLSLSTMEDSLRETVGVLEKKQLSCDALVEKLHALVEELYHRLAQAVCDKWAQLGPSGEALSEAVASDALAGASQLNEEMAEQAATLSSGPVNWHTFGAWLQEFKSRVTTWGAGVNDSIISLNQVFDTSHGIEQFANSLPSVYQEQVKACRVGLQATLDRIASVQVHLREEKAKIMLMMQALELRFKQGIRPVQGPAQLQGGLRANPYSLQDSAGASASGLAFFGAHPDQTGGLFGNLEPARGSLSPAPLFSGPATGVTMPHFAGQRNNSSE